MNGKLGRMAFGAGFCAAELRIVIKGILAAEVSAEIDVTALSDFLSLNAIPYPSTMF